jgi:hypothetical protein
MGPEAVMMLPVALLVLAMPAQSAQAPATSAPAVKVTLSDDRIAPGDWAHARVRVDDDGYLLVLAADPEGNVRILFPRDPGDDAFVRGGRTVDLRGRGSRGSFLVGAAPGTGVVLAARTAQPLQLDGFVQGDHWDYGAIDSAAHDSGAAARNPDEVLLGIAQQMAGGNQLSYDAASYTVDASYASSDRRYYEPSYGGGWDYGYAYPYWYGCYDPWFCGTSFYAGFGFGFVYSPFWYTPFWYRPFYYRPFFGRPVFVGRGYPRAFGRYGTTRGYVGKTLVPAPRSVPYRGRGISGGAQYRSRGSAGSYIVQYRSRTPSASYGGRSSGGSRASAGYAPRVSGPRMAAPSYRSGGGVGGGGGSRASVGRMGGGGGRVSGGGGRAGGGGGRRGR